MSCYAKGRRFEHKARKALEAAGYSVIRAAGSKGPADLIAWDDTAIRFISVKCGGARLSGKERAVLGMMVRPANSTIESWRYPNRCRVVVEVL